MDSLRNAILNYRTKCEDELILIGKLDKLVQENGPEAAQIIFQVYASVDLPRHTARDYWPMLLEHLEVLSALLNRRVSFFVAMCDFLSINTPYLQSPKLIETSAYSKILEETTHDRLTSLFNRPYFDKIFEQNLALAKRYNTSLTLLFLDIDNFKDINDKYGHSVGDETLEKVAETILNKKRESDIAARYGGEEFVLLMPHTGHLDGFILGERIRTAIENLSLNAHGKPYNITISGGLSSYPLNSSQSQVLLDQADSALYLAKGAGKNLISFYKEEKRRYLRVKFSEPVQVKELDFTPTATSSGTGKDICIGGILFQNNTPFPIGARIKVSIPFNEEEPLLLIGTVVRVEAFSEDVFDIGMTISFKEMDKIASREIADFLRQNNVS